MTTVLHVKGYITEDGQLEVELPQGLKPGEVEVTIALTEKAERELPWEEQPWTEEELRAALRFNPVPAKDIVTGGWEDMGIEDSVAWVDEQRRKMMEARGWRTSL